MSVDAVLENGSILTRSEERFQLFRFGEVKERFENGIFVRVLEVVVNDIDYHHVQGSDGLVFQSPGEREREKRRKAFTKVEIIKDFPNDLVRLWSGLTVQHSPLLTQLVRLVFPSLESSRVNDGRLDHFGTWENSPSDGVRTGDSVGTEVARFVDAVVSDRRREVEHREEGFDVFGRAEELEVSLVFHEKTKGGQ